jgi:hypothetical protein
MPDKVYKSSNHIDLKQHFIIKIKNLPQMIFDTNNIYQDTVS